MSNHTHLFDRYSRNARLYPAFLGILPAFVTIYMLFPEIYETIGKTIASLAVGCGALTLIASSVRHFGVKKETKLYKLWGGTPTTIWLRHADKNLDPVTKSRYQNFLLKKVPGFVLFTPQEEKADPIRADDYYKSATKWLLEFTRDKKRFPLVFEELVNYGFQRNTLAIKPIAIFIIFLSIILTAITVYSQHISAWYTDVKYIVPTFISIISLFLWIFIISPNWVRSAANSYARALLASCDSNANLRKLSKHTRKTRK